MGLEVSMQGVDTVHELEGLCDVEGREQDAPQHVDGPPPLACYFRQCLRGLPGLHEIILQRACTTVVYIMVPSDRTIQGSVTCLRYNKES